MKMSRERRAQLLEEGARMRALLRQTTRDWRALGNRILAERRRASAGRIHSAGPRCPEWAMRRSRALVWSPAFRLVVPSQVQANDQAEACTPNPPSRRVDPRHRPTSNSEEPLSITPTVHVALAAVA